MDTDLGRPHAGWVAAVLATYLLLGALGCARKTEEGRPDARQAGRFAARPDSARMAQLQAEAPPGMVWIPGGGFRMGSAEGDLDERPVHEVSVHGFYMDSCEVTVAQFAAFCGATGAAPPVQPAWSRADHPVVNVTWRGAAAFVEWADKRLPTEAEWEYAARGGLTGKPYPGGGLISHDDANYCGTGGADTWNGTSPVGSFRANAYGLYDMAGNVWEWCSDWYESAYYGRSTVSDPTGPETGSVRVLRGGSWGAFDSCIRVSVRNYYGEDECDEYVGFRGVRDARADSLHGEGGSR